MQVEEGESRYERQWLKVSVSTEYLFIFPDAPVYLRTWLFSLSVSPVSIISVLRVSDAVAGDGKCLCPVPKAARGMGCLCAWCAVRASSPALRSKQDKVPLTLA